MSSSPPLRFSIKAALRGSDSGLLGRGYEDAPYLASWATWGLEHRFNTNSPPLPLAESVPAEGAVTLGPYLAPRAAVDGLNGDESIWVKLMTRSTHSGVPALDAANQNNEEYLVQSGTARLTVSDALEAAVSGTPVALPMSDPLLTVTLLRSLTAPDPKNPDAPPPPPPTVAQENEMLRKAYKGTILATIHLESGTKAEALALSKQLKQLEATPRDPREGHALVYGSKEMIDRLKGMQNLLYNAYGDEFFGTLDTRTGAIIKEPTYPLGKEVTVQNLHLPVAMLDQGILPFVGTTQHTIETREEFTPFVTAPASLKKQAIAKSGPTREGALLMNSILDSARLRAPQPLSVQEFVDAVDRQHTQSHTDASISSKFLAVREITVKGATSVANQVRYMKDMRYPNAQYATFPSSQSAPAVATRLADSPVTRVAQAVASHFNPRLNAFSAKRDWHLLTAAKVGSSRSSLRGENGASAAPTGPEIDIECLFPVALYGIAPTDDCDGSGCTAATVLRSLPKLAELVSREEAPLLHASAAIARRHYGMEIACSVSSAYVDTDGKELSKEALKKMQDLPIIGDPVDQRREFGGHAPALWMSRAVVLQMLQSGFGKERVAADLPQLSKTPFAAWEFREPTLIAEGTASIEPGIIPVGEVARALVSDGQVRAPQLEAAALQRKSYIKSLAEQGSGEGPNRVQNPLIEHARFEGQNFYATVQDVNRRCSTFYLGASVAASPDLYLENARYGQLNFVSGDVKKTRGVEFGALLRAPLSASPNTLPKTAAFVPTYAGKISEAEWDMHVRPLMAVIQNQLPLMNLFRVNGGREGQLAQLRMGHVLTPAVLQAVPSLGTTDRAALADAFDKHALGQQRWLTANAPRLKAQSYQGREALLRAASLGAPLALPSSPSSSSSAGATTLTLYMQPWQLTVPGVAAKVTAELDAQVKAGKILSYVPMSDRPLRDGEDVISFIVTLPVNQGKGQ